MPKALIIRYGAYGDMLNIVPALKKLKEQGYHTILNTNKRGKETLEHCPYVDEWMMHDESMPVDQLSKHWEKIKEEVKPDKFINFSESIECNVALHPINPEYIYPKAERSNRCNRNYYDVTEAWAGLEGCDKRPEFHFTKEEEQQARSYLRPGMFNILWVLSGSGQQKVYPWSEYVMGELLKNFENVHIITVGDMKCQLLETIIDKNITNLSGECPMRLSMTLTKFVDLVVAPDTGVLHASGCFETPKIGLLGHTTKENITKYFLNDYSIEAECACAPCFHLIYSHEIQCPVDVVTRAAWCMSSGIQPERLYERICTVRDKYSR
jgi:ADP-heptose:LPS heptosyltransferase